MRQSMTLIPPSIPRENETGGKNKVAGETKGVENWVSRSDANSHCTVTNFLAKSLSKSIATSSLPNNLHWMTLWINMLTKGSLKNSLKLQSALVTDIKRCSVTGGVLPGGPVLCHPSGWEIVPLHILVSGAISERTPEDSDKHCLPCELK